VADTRPFDPSDVARAIDVGSGYVVIGTGGGATFLLNRSAPQPQRMFDAAPPSTDEPFAAWLTEEIAYLWPSRDGDEHYAQSASGQIVRLYDDSGRPPEILGLGITEAALLAFNPEDELQLLADRTLRFPGGEAVLADGVAPTDIRALGILEGDVWLQLPDIMLRYPLECRRPARPDTAIPEGAEPPDCIAETRVAPEADAPIAHLTGSWDRGLGAVLKSADRLRWRDRFLAPDRWSADGSAPLTAVDLQVALAAVIYRRPDGALSLDPGIVQTAHTGGDVDLRLPSGENRRFIDPASLRPPELDLGWIRFERAAGRFVLGTGRAEGVVADDAVLSADGRFLPFQVFAPLPQPDGAILVATPFGLLSARAQPTLAQDRPATAFRSINLREGRFQTDAGGLWQGDRFFSADVGEGDVATAVVDEQLGALTLAGDRRIPAVRISLYGVEAWREGQGFAWDELRDLGWSGDGRPVMDTGVGPVFIDDPVAMERPTELAWSAGSFARLQAAHSLSVPSAGHDFTRTPDGRSIQLLRDALLDASGAFDAMHLATGRGYERAEGFSAPRDLIAPAVALDGFVMHRPTGTLLVGRSTLLGVVRGPDAPLEPLAEGELARLTDPLHYEIGPLDVVATPDGGYRLEIPPFREQERPRLALVADPQDGGRSRLAMDMVRDVALTADGAMVTIGAAGITLSGASTGLSLPDTRLISPTAADSTFALIHEGSRLVALENDGSRITGCANILSDASPTDCGDAPGGTRLTFETALGTLAAERTDDAIRFLLDPGDGAPEMPVAFSDGRLAIDRVAQVAPCGGRIHLVLEVGLRAAHDGMSGAWQRADPVSRIDRRTRLVCTVGHPDARIANALLLGGPDGEWLVLVPEGTDAGDRDVPFNPAAASATLNGPRFAEGLTLLRSDGNSALAHDAGQGFIRNLRIGGQVERLDSFERLGPGAVVDAPRFFISGGGRIWAVTDDALYPFGPSTTAGRTELERDGPRRVILPEACRMPRAAQWVSPDVTDILCNGDVRVVLSLGADVAAADVLLTPRSDTVRLGPLSLSINRGQGLTQLTLAEEPLGADAFDGGFPFDRLVNMAWAAEGVLSVVSAAGWHPYDGTNLSLGANPGLRPEASNFRSAVEPLREARAVYQTHIPRLHCFEVPRGEARQAVFVDLVPDEPRLYSSWNEGCVRFLARDGLREAWSFPDSSVNFFHRLGESETVSDVLFQGRFDGDRISGDANQSLPTLGQSPTGGGAPKPLPYCVQSRLGGLAIAGTIEGASARVSSDTCTAQRDAAPSHADGSEFFAEEGTLYRRRLIAH
jgi:hypothetical protein